MVHSRSFNERAIASIFGVTVASCKSRKTATKIGKPTSLINLLTPSQVTGGVVYGIVHFCHGEEVGVCVFVVP